MDMREQDDSGVPADPFKDFGALHNFKAQAQKLGDPSAT
jgi:hypothetical protein